MTDSIDMKVLSMFLPQFHKVPENDKWWGDGFTDWITTRSAHTLISEHYQPHIPLNKNYYDLTQKETMQWQADLMHKYGIDGQCIYHYWFKNGRRILEKPAENLLTWTDVDMPFCFCWANETWARSWSRIKKANVWNESDGEKSHDGDSGILLEQRYGGEQDWICHFEYLLPFFKDKRYIRYEGKPLFLIYRSSEVYCLEDMAECFNNLAVKNGLPGIYFICANASDALPDNIDAVLIHEPQNCMRNADMDLKNDVRVLNYEQCWDYSIQNINTDRKTYYEGFVGYDDTPRRGMKGTIIFGSTPEIFSQKLTELMAKSHTLENEFVFINAWNEWGEGMHLEPDEKWGYGYLEGVKYAKNKYREEAFVVNDTQNLDEINKLKNQSRKYENYLNTLDQWMLLREQDISLLSFFEDKGYTRIALYGYGIFARHLMEELKCTNVEFAALIDQQKDRLQCDVPIVLPGEEPDGLDAIIVTSFFYYKDVRAMYTTSGIPVISIENIIKEVACNHV